MIDTVDQAATPPEVEQPYLELGLKPEEYERIREILGRRPTSSELAMYSVMWSEHCSYKSSKVHLRQFGEKAPPSDALLVGVRDDDESGCLAAWRPPFEVTQEAVTGAANKPDRSPSSTRAPKSFG